MVMPVKMMSVCKHSILGTSMMSFMMKKVVLYVFVIIVQLHLVGSETKEEACNIETTTWISKSVSITDRDINYKTQLVLYSLEYTRRITNTIPTYHMMHVSRADCAYIFDDVRRTCVVYDNQQQTCFVPNLLNGSDMFRDFKGATEPIIANAELYNGANTYNVYYNLLQGACPCGYAAKQIGSYWYCCEIVSDFCPRGWKATGNFADLRCSKCPVGKYSGILIYNTACNDCLCVSGQYYDDCKYNEKIQCKTCTNPCAKPPGDYYYDPTYESCWLKNTATSGVNSLYDYEECKKLLWFNNTCGSFKVETNNIDYQKVSGTYDNICVPVTDKSLEKAITTGKPVYLAQVKFYYYTPGAFQFAVFDSVYEHFLWIPSNIQGSSNYIGFMPFFWPSDGPNSAILSPYQTYGLPRYGSCANITPIDRAPIGWYHDRCTSVKAERQYGPGVQRICNDRGNQRIGEFVASCSDAQGGIKYKTCLTGGVTCQGASFQVACGVHFSEPDVIWGISSSGTSFTKTYTGTQTTNDTAIANVIGNIGYMGMCIACSNYARAECTDDNFLVQCGQYSNGLVNKNTWAGAASGICISCSDPSLILNYCGSTFRDALSANPGSSWYYPDCSAYYYTFVQDGDMTCQFCDASICDNTTTTFTGCGGQNAGTCTTCTRNDIMNSDISNSISFYRNFDGWECLFQCLGTTGLNCDTSCSSTLQCTNEEYRDTCDGKREVRCLKCANNIPATAYRPVNNRENVLPQSYTVLGDFNYFMRDGIAYIAKGSPLTVSNVGMRYVGNSRVDPPRGLRANSTILIRSCGDTNTDKSTHVLHRYTCTDEKDNFIAFSTPITLSLLHGSPFKTKRPSIVSFWAYGNGVTTFTVSIQRVDGTKQEYSASKTRAHQSQDQWYNMRFILVPPIAMTGLAPSSIIQPDPAETWNLVISVTSTSTVSIDDVVFNVASVAFTHEVSSGSYSFGSDIVHIAIQDLISGIRYLDQSGDPTDNGLYAIRLNTNNSVSMLSFDPDMRVNWITLEFAAIAYQTSATLHVLSIVKQKERLQAVHVVPAGDKWTQYSVSFSTEGFESTDYVFRIVVRSGTLLLDNVVLWQKPGTCAWKCDTGEIRNGESCISCDFATALARSASPINKPCPVDQYFVACTRDGYNAEVVCEPCVTAPPNAHYIATTQDCDWECNDNFYLDAGVCKPCNLQNDCAVGQYRTLCTRFEDSSCKACTTNMFDNAVYITSGSAIGVDDCQFICIPGLYYDGSNCMPCSSVDCTVGDVFLKAVACGLTNDAYCTQCDTPGAGMEVVGSSPAPGQPCQIACIPGFFPCPICPLPTDSDRIISHIYDFVPSTPGYYVGTTTVVMINTQLSMTLPLYTTLDKYTKDAIKIVKVSYTKTTSLTLTLQLAAISNVVIKLSYSMETSGIFRVLRNNVLQSNEALIQTVTPKSFEYTLQLAESGSYAFVIEPQTVGTVTRTMQIFSLSVDMRSFAGDSCVQCGTQQLCRKCDPSQVPPNATAVARISSSNSSLCDWECIPNYRKKGNQCVYCPITRCNSAQYESDCLVCSNCSSLPASLIGKVVYTGSGTTRFVDSCPYECIPGYYQTTDPFACNLCSQPQCATGQYLVACGKQTNAYCTSCQTECQPGTYKTAACNQTADLQCTQCATPLPLGASWVAGCNWTCGENAVYNTETGECQLCQPSCAVGYFQTDCLITNGWSGCEACLVPLGATALSSGIGTQFSCMWSCPASTVPANSSTVCKVVDSVPPAPEVCSKSCSPGRALYQPTCECRACVPDKPNGSLSVWLTDFITLKECSWTCLPPYASDRVNNICIEIPLPEDTTNDTAIKIAENITLTQRRSEQPSQLIKISVAGPLTFLVLCVLLYMLCTRVNKKRRLYDTRV